MFYWIYTKKNTIKPIISRNFATSAEAMKFALRNGLDWTHGDMLKNGERYGEYHKGKIRIGSKIESSVKPKAPKKKVAKDCALIIRDHSEFRYALQQLEPTSAKWKSGKENPMALANMSLNYPIILHVTRNVISWSSAILGTHAHNKIK